MRVSVIFLLALLLVMALEAKKKATSSKSGGLSFSSAFGYKDQVKKGKKSKNSAMVAIPRTKKGKGRGIVSGMSKLGGGLMMRMAREMRTQFSSELEALTLQLTRPTDSPIPDISSREISDFFNGEYDNPQVVVSVLAKLSRKLSEPSVYTKLKALLTVNTILSNTNSQGQVALATCMKSLQQELDSKVGLPFFSFDSVEQAKNNADSVGEIELAELAKKYATFLFYYIDVKAPSSASSLSSKKLKQNGKRHASGKVAKEAAGKVDGLLQSLDHISAVEAVGVEIKALKNRKTLGFQVLETIKSEKTWIVKQLQKVYASGALESDFTQRVESALSELGFDMKPNDSAVDEDEQNDDADALEAAEIEHLTQQIMGEDEDEEDGEDEDEDDVFEPPRKGKKSRQNR